MQRQVNELAPADCAIVLQRELKKRNEAIPFEEQANRPEAKAKLLAEVAIIEEFLPKQMSASALEDLLNTYKSSTAGASMSTAMKFLKENYAGQYDGKSASEIAKRVFA
jgi:uncharacterized protein YqeY